MAMTSETRVMSSFVLILYHKLLVLGILKSTVNDIHVFHTGNPSPDVTLTLSLPTRLYSQSRAMQLLL